MSQLVHKNRNYRLGQWFRRSSKRKLFAISSGVLVLLIVAGFTTAWHGTTEHSDSPKTVVKPAVVNWQTRTPLPDASSKAYGIAAGGSLGALSQTELDKRFSQMAGLGVTWVRFDFDWSVVQPDNQHDYNWSLYDRLVNESNKYHLKVLGILDFTPEWARGQGCENSHCGPADPAYFASYAASAAARYDKKGVVAWEIWNEPNSDVFWGPKSDPRAYTTLLTKSYVAIKQKAPTTTVITAGLSPHATDDTSYSPIDFVTKIYADGGKNYFDALGAHPYTFPLTPASGGDHAWRQMAGDTNSMRQIMTDNGDVDKKIWITEFGAPTNGPGPVSTFQNPNLNQHPYVVDEALQAKILSDALGLYKSYEWVGPFFVYSLQDAGTDPSTSENFFGLIRADGSHKPSYSTYRMTTR